MKICSSALLIIVVSIVSFSNRPLARSESLTDKFGEMRKAQIPWRAPGDCPSGASKAPVQRGKNPCDCQLAPEQALFSDTAAKLEAEPEAPSTSVELVARGPARQSGTCGVNTLLSNTLESGQIEIPTTNGVIRFLPLFLSDKSPFYCVAIRPWTPCLLESKSTESGIELVLGTTKRGVRRARIFIPSNLDRRKTTSTDDNFTVLRRTTPEFSMVEGHDVIKEARKFANSVACPTGQGTLQCKRNQQWAVERRILQIVRAERKPLGAGPGEPDADLNSFEGSILSKLSTPAQRLSALAITRNEIGYVPQQTGRTYTPYEILDAGGPSGLSFGYFQVDLATNSQNQRAPFRSTLAKVTEMHQEDLALKHIANKQWFEHRVQSFSSDVLLAWFRSVRPLYEAARSTTRATIDDQMLNYVRGTSGCLGILADRGAPFATNPVARLYVLDVANHFGPDPIHQLVVAAEGAADAPLKAMLDKLMEITSYGRDKSNRLELENRVKNIEAVVRDFPSDQRNSVDHSDCKIAAIKNIPIIAAR